MALPGNEEIRLSVIIDTKIANKNLKDMISSVGRLEDTIRRLSASSGASFGQVGGYLKNLYATQLQLNGVTGQTATNLRKAFGGEVSSAVKNLNQEVKQTAQSGKGLHQVLNLIRGTLVAIGVFRAFQFVEESLRKAIDTAQEFQLSLYRLINAEKILSKAGTEITVKGLQDGIKEIKEELPIFSETDITQQVSALALLTKELGFNEKQILDLSKSIGILTQASVEEESLMEATSKVVTALITGQARGVSSLSLSFSEFAITTKAVELGLLKAGESAAKLTDQQKAFVKYNIIVGTAAEQLKDFNDTFPEQIKNIEETKAAWEDLLKTIGQIVLPFFANLAPLLKELSKGFDNVKISIAGIGALITAVGVSIGMILDGSIRSISQFTSKFKEVLKGAYEGLTLDLFPELTVEGIETPTDKTKNFVDALESIEGVEAFDDLIKDLENLQQKLDETREDFEREWGDIGIDLDAAINIDSSSSAFDELAREVQDYVIDIQRLVQDYAIKRQRIIDDSNEKVKDANQKARNKELDDEARFQEQMRQLREKFLFNLEDALRERDARQVLRLQRQYQMDKTALENENALKQAEADRQHQEDLERIRNERDDRLAELAEEERLKLQREKEDFELKQQRAQEDHDLEMEQLNQQITERLEMFAEQLGEEFDLNADAVDKLKQLLTEYYGPGGEFDVLYDYSYESLVANAQRMLDVLNQLRATQAAVASLSSNVPRFDSELATYLHPGPRSVGNQANGGTYFANSPTHAIFGEAGPEIATFTPLRKLGQAEVAGGLPAGGAGGKVDIELWLSPDLEARVMNNTLNETANVFTRINRSKN